MPSIALFLLVVPVLLASGCASWQRAPEVNFADAVPTRPAAVVQRAAVPVNGGLYSRASYRPAFEDRRARLIGDTLTIQIVENISASQRSTSTVDRSGSISSGIAAFPFMKEKNVAKLALEAESANVFAGKGGTESANTFSGSITATVVDVLPNGHLVLAGDKQIGVNHNVDVLRFSGTVDPRAIQSGNIVSSTQVANARIESRGRGQQDEAQAMGWLARFFLTVLPF